MAKVQLDSAEDGGNVGAVKDFVFVDAISAGEGGELGVHGFVVFCSFGDFLRDFLVVFAMEEASCDNGKTDSDKKDSEDDFPCDIVGEDVLSCEEQNDADGDEAETHDFVFVGDETDNAGDDNKESPPAIEKDVEAEEAKCVAAENNT